MNSSASRCFLVVMLIAENLLCPPLLPVVAAQTWHLCACLHCEHRRCPLILLPAVDALWPCHRTPKVTGALQPRRALAESTWLSLLGSVCQHAPGSTPQALRERAAESSPFAAVHSLLSGYRAALDRAHLPLALLLAPEAQQRGGALDVVRGGPTLGTLRPATPAEALGMGLAPPGQAGPTKVKSGLNRLMDT